MTKVKVLLDPGHGIDTAGKRSPDGKLREYDWNRRCAAATLALLIDRGIDAEIVVPEITDITLTERCNRANKVAYAVGPGNVAFVSIHVNAAGNGQWMNARGWCVFTYTKPSEKSVRLANLLFDRAKAKGFKTRQPEPLQKYYKANFAVVRQTVCPAVLVEHFFMDNREDCNYLMTDKSIVECSEVLADGIIQYINTL
jgi:N-acetylmuramoyl-L-alanine amidase